MKRIKVLHIIAGLGNGGAERQLIELLKFKKKHGVLILSDAGIYRETLNKLKINYWELGVKNKFCVLIPIEDRTSGLIWFIVPLGVTITTF